MEKERQGTPDLDLFYTFFPCIGYGDRINHLSRSLEQVGGKVYLHSSSKCAQSEIRATRNQEGNESISSYLQRIKCTRDRLSAVGVHVDNEELLHMILKGLPK